ncbi:MAG: hypothetical protein ACYS1A_18100 [Planctomycetota bacterium]
MEIRLGKVAVPQPPPYSPSSPSSPTVPSSPTRSVSPTRTAPHPRRTTVISTSSTTGSQQVPSPLVTHTASPSYVPPQGTPSYVPPVTDTPKEINPEVAGLLPPGAPPLAPKHSYPSGPGGGMGPSAPKEPPPPEQAKKRNWLMWIAIAAAVYFLLFRG